MLNDYSINVDGGDHSILLLHMFFFYTTILQYNFIEL